MPTKIPWTEETLSPFVGCTKKSEGCDNCAALQFAVRHAHNPKFPLDARIAYQSVIEKKDGKWNWNGKTALIESRLNVPLKWNKPRMIFLGFMGDIFHPSNSFADIARVFEVVNKTPQHTYQVLTKREKRMAEYFDIVQDVPENVWPGVSVENQDQANKRIPVLLKIHAKIRFISIEPMLGPVDLTMIEKLTEHGTTFINVLNGTSFGLFDINYQNFKPINWVICGGESGPKARPMHPDWVRSIKDQCQAANVPFFFKQWGEWMIFDDLPSVLRGQLLRGESKWPIKNYSTDDDLVWTFHKISKKQAGSLLDGKEYKSFPGYGKS